MIQREVNPEYLEAVQEIIELRKKVGFQTRGSFSYRLPIGKKTWAQVEQGKRSMPYPIALKVAELCRVSIDDIPKVLIKKRPVNKQVDSKSSTLSSK